jgi:hypothetical protein
LSGKVLDIMKKLDPAIAQKFYDKEQGGFRKLWSLNFVSPSGNLPGCTLQK